GVLDFVIVIFVEYHDRRVVRTTSGKAYARMADEKVTLNDDQIRPLEVEKGQIDLEQEPVSLDYPSDFNADLIRQYVDNLISDKGLTANHTDEQIMSQTRVGKTKNGVFGPKL